MKTSILLLCTAISLGIASCGAPQAESIAGLSQDGATTNATTIADGDPGAPTDSSTTASRYPWGDDGRIAFTFVEEENYEIYIMDSDGEGWTNLTNDPAFDAGPSWSPDGQQIAFYSDRDGTNDIFVMDAAGSNPVNLTNHESSDLGPAWSPDGEYIAFSSNRDGDSDIYVMDTDGGNLINLTNNSASDSGSAWSPNGQQMAFASDRSGNWEIYVLNLSGGSPINVSNHEEAEYNPAWSPDGTAIAFQSSRDSNAIDRIREIYMVDADGENLTRLTAHGHSANYPTWSPDGQWIAYSYGEEGQGEIRVANVDTQEYFTLGEAWSGGTTPAWMGSTTLSAGSVEIPTPDPTDLPQDTDEYETPMIRVPAGTYSIGGDPAQALELCQIFRDQCQIEWFYDEAPIHQVTLEAFFIDQTEVLNVDYARCVSAGVCAPPDQMGSATRTSYYDNPHFNIYPVIYVSWEDAAIYCEWRGARLPTEAEWEVAARGGLEGNPYPWGIEFPLCEAGVLWGASFDDGMSCGGADTQLMASFFPNALGIYDMAGNVLEWTADWYDVYPGGDPGISNEFGEIYRVARGGSWYTYGDALRVSIRFPASPTASFNHYGFRCAASP